jgi:hypothetical protein
MKLLRHAACVLVAAASLLASPAYSTAFTTDQSDLWYVATEAGWGIEFVHRGSVIFATLFVYDPSGNPVWYVSTMQYTGSSFTWSGDLYATTGPYFGTEPFNPANVIATKVGTMTWAAQSVNTGTLTYIVNGTTVVKGTTRETLVDDDFTGHYGGGFHSVTTSCIDPSLDGTVEPIGVFDITQSGQTLTVQTTPTNGTSCSYPGPLIQFGQMGEVSGTYNCANGTTGTFYFYEVQVNVTGVTGRFSTTATSPAGCQSTGWFGGLRVTTY